MDMLHRAGGCCRVTILVSERYIIGLLRVCLMYAQLHSRELTADTALTRERAFCRLCAQRWRVFDSKQQQRQSIFDGCRVSGVSGLL
jgi:hypothetical protein